MCWVDRIRWSGTLVWRQINICSTSHHQNKVGSFCYIEGRSFLFKIFLHHKSFGAKKFCNVKYFNYLLGLHYIILIGNNNIYCHNYKQTQIGNCRLMKWLLVLIKIELTVWSEWYYSFFWRNSPGTLPGLGPMTSLIISFLPTPFRLGTHPDLGPCSSLG